MEILLSDFMLKNLVNLTFKGYKRKVLKLQKPIRTLLHRGNNTALIRLLR